MSKRILILLGHSDTDSLSGHLASVYAQAATAAGHAVRRVNIGELSFDPILHKGYKVVQELEPDLKQLQEDIRWSEHLFLVYPIWWLSAPALLKGLIDRLWLPGFAFRYHKNKEGNRQIGWDQLLKGRTARIVVLLQSIPFLEQIAFGDFVNEIAQGTLGFSGFRTSVTKIGNSEKLSSQKLAEWERKLAKFAARAT